MKLREVWKKGAVTREKCAEKEKEEKDGQKEESRHKDEKARNGKKRKKI